MARTRISEFSATAADNTDIDNIDIAEGCAPSGINNAIRELMAQLKDMQTGASGDTFTFTSLVATSADINGGTVDGAVIGGASAAAATVTSLTDSGNLTFTGTGNRITGDFSNATFTNRVSFQSSTTNGATVVQLIPNGTSTASQVAAYGGSDILNTSVGQLTNNGTEVRFASGIFGTGTYLPMTFLTGGSERARIDTSGNVGIGTSSTNLSSSSNALTVNTGTAGNFSAVEWASGGALNFFINANNAASYISSLGTRPMVFFTNGTESARISSDGNVGINVGAPTSRLSLAKNSPTAYNDSHIEMISGAGDVVLSFHAVGATATCIDHLRGGTGIRSVNSVRTAYAPIEASAFNVPSDYRVKENVTPLTDALNRVALLSPKRFSYIEGSMSYNNGKFVDGFIAHEAALAVPEAVTGEKDAVGDDGKPIMQGIDQAKLVPLLVAAIQELKAEVDALKGAAQ